jgi:hypothetical protein
MAQVSQRDSPLGNRTNGNRIRNSKLLSLPHRETDEVVEKLVCGVARQLRPEWGKGTNQVRLLY